MFQLNLNCEKKHSHSVGGWMREKERLKRGTEKTKVKEEAENEK